MTWSSANGAVDGDSDGGLLAWAEPVKREKPPLCIPSKLTGISTDFYFFNILERPSGTEMFVSTCNFTHVGSRVNRTQENALDGLRLPFMVAAFRKKLFGNSRLGIPGSLRHFLNWKATIILAICVFLGKDAELKVTAKI